MASKKVRSGQTDYRPNVLTLLDGLKRSDVTRPYYDHSRTYILCFCFIFMADDGICILFWAFRRVMLNHFTLHKKLLVLRKNLFTSLE